VCVPLIISCVPILLRTCACVCCHPSSIGHHHHHPSPSSSSPSFSPCVAFRLSRGSAQTEKAGAFFTMARRNVEDMRKAELMKFAADVLGVATRRVGPDGKNNLWRSVEEVRRDCKEKEARLCQSPHASAGSSTSHQVPPAEATASDRKRRKLRSMPEATLCQSPHASASSSSSQQVPSAEPEQARLSQSTHATPVHGSASPQARPVAHPLVEDWTGERRDIASLNKFELREQCRRAGIPTKKPHWTKKGEKCHIYLSKTDLAQKLASHKKASLELYFSRRPGPAAVESDKAPLLSGFARRRCRIALHPLARCDPVVT